MKSAYGRRLATTHGIYWLQVLFYFRNTNDKLVNVFRLNELDFSIFDIFEWFLKIGTCKSTLATRLASNNPQTSSFNAYNQRNTAPTSRHWYRPWQSLCHVTAENSAD